MKRWTEQVALSFIKKHSNIGIEGKNIHLRKSNGLSGLTSCSALDYLVNHCGYRKL